MSMLGANLRELKWLVLMVFAIDMFVVSRVLSLDLPPYTTLTDYCSLPLIFL